MIDWIVEDQSNSPSSMGETILVPFTANDSFNFFDRTIDTKAILMSFRIINETRKPDHDRKYKTKRAGIQSEIGNEFR